MIKRILLSINLVLFFLLLSNPEDAYAQQISNTYTGDWSITVTSDQILDAGEDYPASYTSALDQSLITIKKKPSSDLFPWRVDVRYDNVNWNDLLEIWIKRTSDGVLQTQGAYITGGNVFQLVYNSDNYFFEGAGTIKNISIQYQLSGISVLLPADNYSCSIYLTLIEL